MPGDLPPVGARVRFAVAKLNSHPCPHCGSSAWANGQSWAEIDDPVLVGRSELERLSAFASLVADLDRNDNGRHEGDVDSGDPSGVSQGNPFLPTGTLIGHTMDGRAIVVPSRSRRHDPAAWVSADEIEEVPTDD